VIDRQIQLMTNLINDLLDISRIALGKLELRKERVALATVVQGRSRRAGRSSNGSATNSSSFSRPTRSHSKRT